MEWYYVDSKNEQVGPFDEDDMAALIAGSKVLPDSLVWKDGYPDWVPARSVQEFSLLFVDYGEQATMIGGMTFAQGTFQTDVQAPSYTGSSPQVDKSPLQSSQSSKPAGEVGLLSRAISWVRRLIGR